MDDVAQLDWLGWVRTSDHGNVEDTSAKRHTLNPVPTLLIGAGHERIAPRIHALTDLTPAVVDYLLHPSAGNDDSSTE